MVSLWGVAFAQTPPGFVSPKLIAPAQPTYPEEAKAAGIEGQVAVELVVDVAGAVTDVTLKSGLGHGLDEAAIEAARRLQFSPGTYEGKPVPVKILYRFTFALPKAPPPPAPEPDAPPEPTTPVATASDGPIRLRGDVIEAGTRTPLFGAQVTVLDSEDHELARVEVDDQAAFAIKLPLRATLTEITVVVTALDHKPTKLKEKLRPGEALRVRYALRRNTYARYETVVRGAPVREEIARVTLDGDELRRIPGTRGDALAATFNLPSVARAPFDFGNLILRGSGPGQSAPFLMGMQIPQAFHFAGFTSTFNSYLLERFELIPSNFSARYGRLTGGIIEIVPRAGKTDRIHGDIKIDIIDAHVMVEGPIGKGSFALAARRSYIDAVLKAARLGSFSIAPRYYDYQAMLDYPVLGGKLKVMFYGSDDDAILIVDEAAGDPQLRGRFSNRNWFHGLFINYKKTFGDVDIDTTFLVAPQLFSAALGQVARFNAFEVQTDWRLEARWRVSSRFLLVGGLDLQSGWSRNSVEAPRPVTEEGTQPPFVTSEKITLKSQGYNIAPALYLIANLKITPRFTFEPGLRFDWFSRYTGYTYPQPRLQARYEVAPKIFLKAALGSYAGRQDAPTDNRVLGNGRIRAQHALHATIGVEASPFRNYRPFKLEANVFYKHLWKLSVGSDRNVLRDGKVVPEVYIDEGVGRVYGADLLLKHDGPKWLYGWISYTVMRSERQDHPGEPWRRFQYDQTHILTMVLGYHLPWEVDVGLRLRYATGNPTTPIVGAVYAADYDVYVPIPGAAFSERLPDFVSLDLRIDKRFVFKSWILSVYIDVANVMNRRNVESYNYSYDYTRKAAFGGLPILPSFGLRASF